MTGKIAEEQRAHIRIDVLEDRFALHLEQHDRFERSLLENTEATKQIANSLSTVACDTAELVTLVKGAKGFRKFIIWVMPVAIAGGGVWTWLKSIK